MRSAIIVFPASNCDRDAADALTRHTGKAPLMVWHADRELPKVDLVVLPGGFSYGDYLRSGAMAARSPVMDAVRAHAARGGLTLGICNGFQILTEAGLLPGTLLRNAGLKFLCKPVALKVENTDSPFTKNYTKGQTLTIPIAHHDGNYFADNATLDRLEGEGQVAFRYLENPNGSQRGIAGIVNETRNVLGLMPHPERHADVLTGGLDGAAMFQGLAA